MALANKEQQTKELITVLIIEPGKEPYTKDIASSLEALQGEVGGFIEAVYPFSEPVAIITNEEGKLIGLPMNRALRDDNGKIYDIIAGTFIIAGLTEDNFGSLEDTHIRQFKDYFRVPEQFVKIGRQLIVVPMEKEPVKHNKSKENERNEPEI